MRDLRERRAKNNNEEDDVIVILLYLIFFMKLSENESNEEEKRVRLGRLDFDLQKKLNVNRQTDSDQFPQKKNLRTSIVYLYGKPSTCDFD